MSSPLTAAVSGLRLRVMLPLLCVLALAACGRGVSQASPGSEDLRAAELRRAYSLPSAQWPRAWLDPGVDAPELAPLPPMPYPERNPWSSTKAELGRLLFFDPRLSASGQIACASCHDSQFGWADGKRLAIGYARAEGMMNTPSIVNAGYQKELFWDGRAASLEAQSREIGRASCRERV